MRCEQISPCKCRHTITGSLSTKTHLVNSQWLQSQHPQLQPWDLILYNLRMAAHFLWPNSLTLILTFRYTGQESYVCDVRPTSIGTYFGENWRCELQAWGADQPGVSHPAQHHGISRYMQLCITGIWLDPAAGYLKYPPLPGNKVEKNDQPQLHWETSKWVCVSDLSCGGQGQDPQQLLCYGKLCCHSHQRAKSYKRIGRGSAAFKTQDVRAIIADNNHYIKTIDVHPSVCYGRSAEMTSRYRMLYFWLLSVGS